MIACNEHIKNQGGYLINQGSSLSPEGQLFDNRIMHDIVRLINPHIISNKAEILRLNISNEFCRLTEGKDSTNSILAMHFKSMWYSNRKFDLINGIGDFLKLNADWDGYGGIPMSETVYDNCIGLIHALSDEAIAEISDYFPNPNGTLSIIWECEDSSRLSIEIGEKSFSYYLFVPGSDPQFFNNSSFDENSFNILEENISKLFEIA